MNLRNLHKYSQLIKHKEKQKKQLGKKRKKYSSIDKMMSDQPPGMGVSYSNNVVVHQDQLGLLEDDNDIDTVNDDAY